MTVGDRIKIILNYKRMTQKEFANKINIDRASVNKLVNNKKKITLEELEKICKVLNVPFNCILGEVPIFDEMLSSFSIKSKEFLW